jgi:hypothetical protein
MSIPSSEITVTRGREGQWVVSAVINGYYESRQFFGYSRREAVSMFRAGR